MSRIRSLWRNLVHRKVADAAIGLLLAAVSSRVLGRLLFGLPPLDPLTFGGAIVLFVTVGFVACYVPARRALRVNVVDALRYE